jgi:hypothetical protein
MRTLQTLVLSSAAAAFLASVPGAWAAAADSDAQAKAREAMRQKVTELGAQTPTAPAEVTAPASNDAKKAVVDARKEVKEPAKTSPAPASAVAPSASDSEAVAKAREATRQKVQQLEGEQAAAPVAQPKAEKAPKATSAPKAETKAASATTKAAVESKPAESTKEVKQKSVEASGTELKPLERTPLPISQDKQDRLAELLKRYKADELTPEQYHAERAKILKE